MDKLLSDYCKEEYLNDTFILYYPLLSKDEGNLVKFYMKLHYFEFFKDHGRCFVNLTRAYYWCEFLDMIRQQGYNEGHINSFCNSGYYVDVEGFYVKKHIANNSKSNFGHYGNSET
jgi:hypothetical protein